MAGKSFLVTGAAGFVGACVVHRLLELDAEVTCVIREKSDVWRLDACMDRIQLQKGDLSDSSFVASVAEGAAFDVIVHAAAHGAYSFQRVLTEMVASNVLGFANLLEHFAGRGGPRIVNLGSSSEYGDVDHAPLEAEPPRPNSAYAATKATASWLGALARSEGADVVTLRLYSVYGPYEDPRRLIPALCRAALRGEWPPFADPDVVRDFVFVDDVVDAILSVADHAGELAPVYNVGSGTETSLRQLASVASAVFGLGDRPRFGSYPRRSWDVSVWRADPSLIASDIGWTAATSLADGLRVTASWLKTRDSA